LLLVDGNGVGALWREFIKGTKELVDLAGRLFTFIILILGLVFVAVPTGIVASALSAVRREEEAANNSNTLGKPEA
tara:strand:- start:180415 stop:180642 length:228 start_codon:yes stop_codon:yes gene_type:complete